MVCLTPPQMNDFGDLLGTPYAPVSKILPVKIYLMIMYVISKQIIQTSGLYNGDKFLQAINNNVDVASQFSESDS